MDSDPVSPWPFPHVVMDGAFEDDLLDQVVGEFPDPASSAWGVFDNPRERKQACEDERFFGLATGHLLETLRSEEYCNNLGYLFGIPDLTASIFGGGYHQIPTDGLLAMHVDFNRGHGLHRRLNHLTFLNRDYLPEYGGQLLLGEDGQVVIEPVFNRTAIFATSEQSWHGHPTPWAGPSPRKSFAVYYFSPEPASDAPEHSTVFR